MLSGIYRGVITNSVDPSGLNRLYVSIPVLTGLNSVWAFPCLTGSMPQVKNGDGVWIMFEGGDIAYPVWVGFFGSVSPTHGHSQYANVSHKHPSTADFRWNYDSNITMADPGVGKVRTDTPVGVPSTQISFSDISLGNLDVTAVLSFLAVDDIIYFQQTNNSDNWGRFLISGTPVGNPTWWRIPVTSLEQHGTLNKNNDVLVRFTYWGPS